MKTGIASARRNEKGKWTSTTGYKEVAETPDERTKAGQFIQNIVSHRSGELVVPSSWLQNDNLYLKNILDTVQTLTMILLPIVAERLLVQRPSCFPQCATTILAPVVAVPKHKVDPFLHQIDFEPRPGRKSIPRIQFGSFDFSSLPAARQKHSDTYRSFLTPAHSGDPTLPSCLTALFVPSLPFGQGTGFTALIIPLSQHIQRHKGKDGFSDMIEFRKLNIAFHYFK